MLFRDVITLVEITNSENNMGDVIETKTDREVFANKKSVRHNEFYQSMAHGLRPEFMFEVRSIEYEGEKRLKYNDKEYSVIRSYDKNGEITELIVEGVVNNATS